MFWADNFVLTPGHTGAGARGGGGGHVARTIPVNVSLLKCVMQ